ncbi:MAG: helix-turn-helix transcriptional regulator [Candidatus Promineifilaceae bacterium]|nr:helix-turn-helix transcriptional regulator [Candidatus Promineifilaceae bacterium]
MKDDRAAKLGNLVADARQSARQTAEACGAMLNMTRDEFLEVEQGERTLTLPELELLAMFLGVSMSHFWGGATQVSGRAQPDPEHYRQLRRRMIGAQLSQARLRAGLSQAEVAERAGLEPDRLGAYESGAEPIPYFALEALARAVEISVRELSDLQHGPLSQHELNLAMQRYFRELPPEMRVFLADPVNVRYLEVAYRLSRMDVERLRGIAEGILEITL